MDENSHQLVSRTCQYGCIQGRTVGHLQLELHTHCDDEGDAFASRFLLVLVGETSHQRRRAVHFLLGEDPLAVAHGTSQLFMD